MSVRGKTGGGTGTNQYQTRGASVKTAAPPLVIVPDRIPGPLRCGEVWGIECQHIVKPPQFVHHNHPPVVARLDTAANVHSPKPVLASLVRDPDMEVRRALARNPATPPNTLMFLSEDAQYPVRIRVAMHPATPSFAKEKLALDPAPQVRAALAAAQVAPVGLQLQQWELPLELAC